MIRGSQKIGRLLELKVNLASGNATADTIPKEPRFHYEEDSDDEKDRMMTPEQKRDLLMQFDMNRQSMPKSFK